MTAVRRTPQTGDFLLTEIHGPAGVFITWAQDVWCQKPSRWDHAAYVVSPTVALEAPGPGGLSRLVTTASAARGTCLVVRPPLSPQQLLRAADEACDGLVGVPYSLADYAQLAALHRGVKLRVTRAYVSSTGHMICSQLVDERYRRLGFKMFDDGRLPLDVMPADLDMLWQRMGWTAFTWTPA